MKKRIVSGITATGNLTLGNYIGSIKNLVIKQNEYDIFMFVADLHGITLPIDPNELRENVRKQLATFIACGIDVNKTKLFKQSDIQGHTEMFYYLTTISNEGQLKRMTQFKDKLIKNNNKTEQIPLGLLVYPILMAGDILLYNAEGVIVGLDQKQHLELTRDLAIKLNSKYNLNFKIPEPIISSFGSKIMALKTPTKKMSKSDSDLNETIFLLDDPKVAKEKIMTSLTDSENKVYYDKDKKPGISNLLTILSVIKGITIEECVNEFKNSNYKEFKKSVAEAVAELLETIQKKYYSLTDEDIQNALDKNRNKIQQEASLNLEKVMKGFGMR
ncbi:MAG: tryptophan--tRNA ligase [Candidatus Tyloplasma litorale]|nr:MAG: tryptophan--tRNA ligase [Mycoplasmatales bacterium]